MAVSLCGLCLWCEGFFFFFLKGCFDMDTSHIFPQGMLNAITLLGWLVVLGDLKPVQSERRDFLSAQGLSPPYRRQGLLSSCWSRSLRVELEQALFPLSACFAPKDGSAEVRLMYSHWSDVPPV